VTTLDAASYPAHEVMALYRLRWQIELLFKRLKSQIHLADLQAKDAKLARAALLAKLILALLAEKLACDLCHPFRPAPARARRPLCGA
jgi:IS4 transposase